MVVSPGPSWFLEVDVLFDIIFVLATGLVTFIGFKAYRFFKDEKHKLHSTGFLFLCGSYLLLMLSNLFILLEIRDVQYTLHDLLQIANVIYVGGFLHAVMFLAGLTLLLIVYLPVEKHSIRLLITILVMFGVLLSHQMESAFYLLVSVLLLFIIYHLYLNYRQKRKSKALLVLLGFIAVFIGEVLLSIVFLGQTVYVAAGMVTFIGYLLVLISLVVR